MICLKIHLNALMDLCHKSLFFSKIKASNKQYHLIQEKPFKPDFHKDTLTQKKSVGKAVKVGKKNKMIIRGNIHTQNHTQNGRDWKGPLWVI